VPKAEVLVALLVFRLLYLIVPLALGLVVVMVFEKGRLAEALRSPSAVLPDGVPPDRQAPSNSNIVRLDEAARRARKGGGTQA
jgi:hypothetical protein